jgi:hypothetical protein
MMERDIPSSTGFAAAAVDDAGLPMMTRAGSSARTDHSRYPLTGVLANMGSLLLSTGWPSFPGKQCPVPGALNIYKNSDALSRKKEGVSSREKETVCFVIDVWATTGKGERNDVPLESVESELVHVV